MITLVPVGGLANRMRAIASAATLAEKCNTRLRIIWFKDAGLNCRYDELFEPPVEQPAGYPCYAPQVNVREASRLDLLRYDRPRKGNLHLTRFLLRREFNACLEEDEVIRRRDEGFDFTAWVGTHGNVYIASYIAFVPYENELLRSLFTPVAPILEKINKISTDFNQHTTGVHIRRTDNIHSIRLSPLSLFIERMEEEIRQDPEANFYVASDSPDDKAELIRLFGNRIVTHAFDTRRNSKQGIRDAAAELFVLSRTQKILGSAWSSFSEVAAQINNRECIILKKES